MSSQSRSGRNDRIIATWNGLKNDAERWAFLINNAAIAGLMVILDNDITHVVFIEEHKSGEGCWADSDRLVSLDHSIGRDVGISMMLKGAGIYSEAA